MNQPRALFLVGDAREQLARLPAASVHAVITSPPYWGLRVYAGAQDVAWADGTKVALASRALGRRSVYVDASASYRDAAVARYQRAWSTTSGNTATGEGRSAAEKAR